MTNTHRVCGATEQVVAGSVKTNASHGAVMRTNHVRARCRLLHTPHTDRAVQRCREHQLLVGTKHKPGSDNGTLSRHKTQTWLRQQNHWSTQNTNLAQIIEFMVGTKHKPGSDNGIVVGTKHKHGSDNGILFGTKHKPGSDNGILVGTKHKHGSDNGILVGTKHKHGSDNRILVGTKHKRGSANGSLVGTKQEVFVDQKP